MPCKPSRCQSGGRRRDALRTRRRMGMFLVVLAAVVGMIGGGCGTAMKYQPNLQLIAELGVQQAQQRLQEILLRSVNPPINAVEITDQFVRVDLTGTTYQVRVFFKEVTRTDVYTNHLVVVWGSGTDILFRPVFGNEQDAMAFADLILSFQAHRSGS